MSYTREEQYLSVIATQSGNIPEPITREEQYLAKIAGADIQIPESKTRKEQYLEVIAKNGSGGGGQGSGSSADSKQGAMCIYGEITEVADNGEV